LAPGFAACETIRHFLLGSLLRLLLAGTMGVTFINKRFQIR
jgi:hypothetical protein